MVTVKQEVQMAIDINSDTFVIRNRVTLKFIKIDQSSGGYPYETEIYNAFHFGKVEAHQYRQIMHDETWDLYKLYLNDRRMTWELVEWYTPLIKNKDQE
jgi:hypothetical protein